MVSTMNLRCKFIGCERRLVVHCVGVLVKDTLLAVLFLEAIQKNHLIKVSGYQPQSSTSAGSLYLDLDYSG